MISTQAFLLFVAPLLLLIVGLAFIGAFYVPSLIRSLRHRSGTSTAKPPISITITGTRYQG